MEPKSPTIQKRYTGGPKNDVFFQQQVTFVKLRAIARDNQGCNRVTYWAPRWSQKLEIRYLHELCLEFRII